MAGRKLPKEVQAIFDKYSQKNVRRLKKDDAVGMLISEFHLSDEQANTMFETFDQDKNGIMSIWEFQQFYMTVGKSAQDMLDKFKEMDADGSGKLDISEAKAGLVAMNIGEKESEFFIKSSVGEDGQIDIGAFASLLFRLKMFTDKKGKK